MALLSFVLLIDRSLAADAPSQPATPEHPSERWWENLEKAPEDIVGDTVLIRPWSPYYGTSVAETGVQGTVILLLDLSKDGKVTAARVHTSSHSDALDGSAIRKALTMSYQGRGAAPATASLKVEFRRDTSSGLFSKSCRDFNVDLAWFRKAFPGRPETDLASIAVLGNLVRLNFGSRDRWEREPALNAMPFAQCAVIGKCAANPDALVGDVFNLAMKEHIKDPAADKELCAFTAPSKTDGEKLPRSLLRVAIDEPIWARTQYITPEMEEYPPKLASSGVQGQVVLEVTLTRQREITAISVQNNQSGVSALADAAVAYARRLPWSQAPPTDAPETIVIVPIEFNKDTKASIDDKTCADFSIDYAAYTSAHPSVDLRTMNVVRVALTVLLDRQLAAGSTEYVRQRAATSEDVRTTAELCAKQPQAKFIDAFQQQIQSAKP
jgi:TonB family protein